MGPNNSAGRKDHVKSGCTQGKTNIFGLNEEQRRAAEFKDEHALVLAGAGCGKTKTIEGRCKHLISIGVPAYQIVVLTFTRRSADEIAKRVESSLGNRAKDLQATTMHAFCMKLIRRYEPDHQLLCAAFSAADTRHAVEAARRHPTGQLAAGVFAAIVYQLLGGLGLLDSINEALVILQEKPDHAETSEARQASPSSVFAVR